ncbi:hypothetical protein N7523_000975, partial [Penicillium sp. IBT 18751x]
DFSPKVHSGSQRPTSPRNVTYFSGIHLLSDQGRRWIERQVGETVDREKICGLELPWTNPRRLYEDATTSYVSVVEQPCRNILEIYARRYTSSFQSLVFPVISRSLFTKTLDLAYGPPDAFGYASAKACVYSLISLVNVFGLNEDIHTAVDCGAYASEAQRLVSRIIDEMTVDGLQSLIMLAQLQYFLGDLQSAAVSISVATRLLYTLGGHTVADNVDSASALPPYNKGVLECHLRDLFWLCYSFDKDICLRIGQPPSINDSDCDLSLPLDYVRFQNSNMQRDTITVDDLTLPFFPWDIRLSKIKSKAYQALYSTSARRKSDSEILSSIRHLDAALEEWRLSLHSDIRPMLCLSRNLPVQTTLNTQVVMMRLAYYHCVTIVHEASDRRNISATNTESKFKGISSSASISTTASRSTISLLQGALPVVKGECFW